ncbi:MAG: hypothetical protein MUO77_15760 [Anaerolineales bacterium]|nr:hypothetical protein [Anaerolineales bacterium]
MDDTVNPTPDPNSPTGIYIPSDLQGCFRELDSMLPASMREDIRASEEASLARHHFGLGMWMRNNWGLWSEGSPLKQYFDGQGIHEADDASSMILTSYWRYLNPKS